MGHQLQNFRPGDSTLVTAVNLGEKERRRLESMGIFPGAEISILAKGPGPMIVAVGESRVVIEKGIAENIIVV